MIDLDFSTFYKDCVYQHYLEESEEYKSLFGRMLNLFKTYALDIDDGPWLAGGSIQRLLNPKNTVVCLKDLKICKTDFDIFFKTEKQLKQFIDFYYLDAAPANDTKNAISYSFRDQIFKENIKVQLIKRFFSSVDELLNNFDFTLCQFATDGDILVVGDRTLDDVKNRQCIINKIDNPINAIYRLIKFAKNGYNIPVETIYKILESKQEHSPFYEMENDQKTDLGISSKQLVSAIQDIHIRGVFETPGIF